MFYGPSFLLHNEAETSRCSMHTGPSDGVLVQSCPGSPDSSLQAIHIGFRCGPMMRSSSYQTKKSSGVQSRE